MCARAFLHNVIDTLCRCLFLGSNARGCGKCRKLNEGTKEGIEEGMGAESENDNRRVTKEKQTNKNDKKKE